MTGRSGPTLVTTSRSTMSPSPTVILPCTSTIAISPICREAVCILRHRSLMPLRLRIPAANVAISPRSVRTTMRE
jgi:hypothetical protein